MGDGEFHAFVVVDSDICHIRICNNIVVIQNGRCSAGLKIFHPRIIQRKSNDKGSQILVLQHKNIVRGAFLQFFSSIYNIYGITGRFCKLAEAEQDSYPN